jgi:hypothetical protein
MNTNNFVILAATQFNVKVWVVGCFNNKEEADALMEKLDSKRYNVTKEDVTNLLAIHPRAVPKNFDAPEKNERKLERERGIYKEGEHINYWSIDLNQECEPIRYAYGNSSIEWEESIY